MPRFWPFWNAFASMAAEPSAEVTLKPARVSLTEWKPVPVATSSTVSLPRARSTSMKNCPSLSARASQSINSSHFSTNDMMYSPR